MFLTWDKDDRDKALWQMLRERQKCPHCGTRPDEWAGPGGAHLNAYKAEARLCHGCRAISHARDGVGKDVPAGVQIVLKRGGGRGQ